MPAPLHVLFVPGVPTDPADLRLLFDSLPPGAVGYIFRPPGYGAPANGPGDFDTRAAALREAVDRLPPEGRWIVGYSAGGYDALRVLAAGAQVDGVVLLNAAFGPEGEADLARFDGLADAVASGVFTRELLASAMLTETGLRDPECAERAARWMEAASREHLAAELRSYARQPLLEHVVAEHAARIVIVHAEHDQSIPFARAGALAERTGAAFVAIPGLGHAACIEDPTATCRALRQAWSRRD